MSTEVVHHEKMTIALHAMIVIGACKQRQDHSCWGCVDWKKRYTDNPDLPGASTAAIIAAGNCSSGSQQAREWKEKWLK